MNPPSETDPSDKDAHARTDAGSRPVKASDQEIDFLQRDSRANIESGRRWERWVRNTVMALGSLWAVSLPFNAKWPDDSQGGMEHPHKPTAHTHQPLEVGHPHKPEDYGHPHPSIDLRHTHEASEVGHPHPQGESGDTTHEVYVTTPTLRIISSPQSEAWHRSAFVQTGDEFWALPDANFKMQLAEVRQPCRRIACEVDFDIELLGGAGYQRVTLTNRDFSNVGVCTTVASGRLNPGDGVLPELSCQLSSATNPDVCVRMRRSQVLEDNGESVALDIRWQAGSC